MLRRKPIQIELLWDANAQIAESPVWDDRSDRILFADVLGGRIFGIEDTNRSTWVLPGKVGSFGLCESGRLVVALDRRIVLLDPTSGDVVALSDEIDEPPGNRFNDGKVGPDGCFWVGTRDARLDAGPVEGGTGALYRVKPDGHMQRMASGYAMSNGLAWSPDSTFLYHADTPRHQIDVWTFDARTGSIGEQRPFVTVDPALGRPDGAATDVDGCYWSAGISAGCLNRFSPRGDLIQQIALPTYGPTMPCFSNDWLYVTSSKRRPRDYASRFRYNVGGLFRSPLPAVGTTVHRFADSQ